MSGATATSSGRDFLEDIGKALALGTVLLLNNSWRRIVSLAAVAG
jgi:hypothetical protein